MSIALANEVKHLRQEIDALVLLVKALAAEIDALKEAPKRGRPPKEPNGR